MASWQIVLLVVAAAYHLYVAWLVASNDAAERGQKWLQLGLILLLPVLGALLVHWISVGQSRDRDRPSGEFHPPRTDWDSWPRFRIFNDD